MDYRSAGVDIDAADRLIERIKHIAGRTRTAGVMGGIGGFGALYELPFGRYREPVLVSGTDGVGTKLRLAVETGQHRGVGIDLVAMCVNDILVLGAEPLFFLDYFATGKLDVEVAAAVVEGVAEGCRLAGAALIGGETAELPGMYHGGDYDLAGFCVGVVEKSAIIDGRAVSRGDTLIGIASSGPHSNGYSLIRKIVAAGGHDLGEKLGNETLAEILLQPTRIYAAALRALTDAVPVHAMAHITGGGLIDNLPRVLPASTRASLDPGRWRRPPVFDWLQTHGDIGEREMYRTFNCGIGMVVCVAAERAEEACEVLSRQGEEASVIGVVEAHEGVADVHIAGVTDE